MKTLSLRRFLGHDETLVFISGQSEVNLDNPFIFVRIKHGVHLLVCVYSSIKWKRAFFSFPQNEARYKGRALAFWYLVPKGDACGLLRKPILAQSRVSAIGNIFVWKDRIRSFHSGYARSQGRRKVMFFDLIEAQSNLFFYKTAFVRCTNRYVYLAFFCNVSTSNEFIRQG